MTTLSFEFPWMFLLAVPVAAALIWCWTRSAPSIAVPSVRAFRAVNRARGTFDYRKHLTLLLFLLGFCALIVALARPREGLEQIRSRADGIDIMLAVDLSGSMDAIDSSRPLSESQFAAAVKSGLLKSRIDTAKAEIARFIEMRPNDRIGLIAFASMPFVVCPPTLDHAFLLANLMRLETTSLGDGTGIAPPVASALKRLKDSDAKSRIIVLFTDGANNVQAQITPREAAKLADSFQITLYTVGIGSEHARFPSRSLFETRYMPYEDQFDEPLLRDMAADSGGRYYRVADADGLREAMAQIDKLERNSVEQPVVTLWRELYPFWSMLAGAFLLLAVLAQNTFCMKYP